jgi:HD-GYP domain-containing protein (c-di-GMP phosphodiesterase class II)
LRDPHGDGHERRAAQLARALAAELKMSNNEIELLEDAMELHDVGKNMIPEAILNKPKLTAAELIMVRNHTELGSRAIRPLRFNKAIEEVIHSHHENWNGSGYPDGLKREEIPLMARIARIVDCFDAMTHKRPYHEEIYSIVDAIAEMDLENGIAFDPKIFYVFKRMILDHE